MRRTNKKGFTIVELVIVIAVIAILAAVLIPTFSSLVKKANESADIQAVRQMNTALASEFTTEAPTDLEAVIKALANNGFNAEDTLVPISTGYSFVWHTGEKEIVLIDENKNVVFPEGATYDADKAHDLKDGKTLIPVNVADASSLSQAITAGMKNITLTEDVVLSGTALEIGADCTIDGNGKTLSMGGNGDNQNTTLWTAKVSSSNDITLTLKNLTIEAPKVDSGYTRAIEIAGNQGNVKIVIEHSEIVCEKYYAINILNDNSKTVDLTVKDSTINGWSAVQTHLANSKLTLENCTLVGTDSWNYAASGDNDYSTIVIGQKATGSVLTFNNCTIEAKDGYKNTENQTGEQTLFSINTNATINCNGCTFKYNDQEISKTDILKERTDTTDTAIKGKCVYIYVPSSVSSYTFNIND